MGPCTKMSSAMTLLLGVPFLPLKLQCVPKQGGITREFNCWEFLLEFLKLLIH